MLVSKLRSGQVTRKCQVTGAQFHISKAEQAAYNSFGLPLPRMCAEERLRRKLAFVNLERFTQRSCDATGKSMLSVYPSASQFPVVSPEVIGEQTSEQLELSKDFNFNLSFIEQLLAIWSNVARPAFIGKHLRDTFAAHYVEGASDCSYIFLSRNIVNCHYSRGLVDCRSCYDSYYLFNCVLCYESLHCENSDTLRFCDSSFNCRDSWFLSGCKNTKNSAFCANIEDAEYYLFNKSVGKQKYEEYMQELALFTREGFEVAKRRFFDFLKSESVSHLISKNSQAVSGNYLWNCKNMEKSFDCRNSEKGICCDSLFNASICLDGVGSWGDSSHLAQFAMVGDNAHHVRNSVECWGNVSNLDYCSHCSDSSNLFGCVGLHEKEFCILNKQYSELEYQEMRGKIIKHMKQKNDWGSFFPPGFCGLPYNFSAAQMYFPLGRVPAKLMGFRWSDEDEAIALERTDYLIPPDSIDELEVREDDNTEYLCDLSAKRFRLFHHEVAIYRELGVPVPQLCPEQRIVERLQRISTRSVKKRRLSGWSLTKVDTAFDESWPRPVVEQSNR